MTELSSAPAHVPAARVALVGDRSPTVRAHSRIPEVLAALAERDGLVTDPYWISTGDAVDPGVLTGFDAVWLVPGSPYRSEAGAVAAVRAARERGVPFLGTCGGFQHAVLEYARTVGGLSAAGHANNDPDTTQPLVSPLACSLVGRQGEVRITAGTLAERAFGTERSVERYHCAFALNPEYLPRLRGWGLVFSGVDTEGAPRIVELPGHPFFLGTLFQPELAGDDGRPPHPVIRALVRAAFAYRAAVGRG
ncbi:hypothetical protein RM844_19905 [Streptomyces sp. DSM 44915]|uniref:CTP synthase (glutamine hydrolyzing) n=1 Tax=Streptomyces chisholmiae TaxID=3075540 RepID=A0ABU2JU84_9ACTN|nr:hypothetical protein [Streptomyces sp. DSM 44915]MDT0268555.1 hypothetical protein [Streptomyces sp. DSM 44915]